MTILLVHRLKLINIDQAPKLEHKSQKVNLDEHGLWNLCLPFEGLMARALAALQDSLLQFQSSDAQRRLSAKGMMILQLQIKLTHYQQDAHQSDTSAEEELSRQMSTCR